MLKDTFTFYIVCICAHSDCVFVFIHFVFEVRKNTEKI